jgi:phosphatidylinositol kinase/protein kinase (PI-3  family)
MEEKLKGIAGNGPPLSIEAQVAQLLRSATDPQNLGRMYVGWGPWY